MKFEINNRWTGSIIFATETKTIALAVNAAIAAGANLSSANLPSPSVVLLAAWGTLSAELTADLMVYDASFHPDETAFTRWAEGGACPYEHAHVQRACIFNEDRTQWGKGKLVKPFTLMLRLFKEKSITW